MHIGEIKTHPTNPDIAFVAVIVFLWSADEWDHGFRDGDVWKPISGDLSFSSYPDKNSTAAGAIAESSVKPGLIYPGTDKGIFRVTINDGISCKELSSCLPNNHIRSICPSKSKESRAYITLTGINYDDLASYVHISEDYGKTLTSLCANLLYFCSYCLFIYCFRLVSELKF